MASPGSVTWELIDGATVVQMTIVGCLHCGGHIQHRFFLSIWKIRFGTDFFYYELASKNESVKVNIALK